YIFWVQGDTVTVADMTFGWCTNHGIQAHGQSPYDVRGLWVHNCRIVNCYEQFIKGTSADGDPEGVTDGLIENCLFEFTNRWAYQYYTGGIDIHKGVNWTVRDNLFRYIRAPDSYAEHAIHFWKRCTTRPQNIVAERNVIINCDRGIGFGLGGWADGHDGGSSAIRNNCVYNDGDGPNTDVGIGLESANDVVVDNNTVYVPYWAPIEYRWSGSSNLVFRNNLVNGSITARDGAPAAAKSNNLESVQAWWFRGLTNGDLHIRPGVTNVINRGCAVAAFSDDLDGHARPYGSAWDIGADEWDADRTDTDGDFMVDGWELAYDLDPTDPSDLSDNNDGDAHDNISEWIALTDPTDSNDFFRIGGGAYANSFAVWFECSTARIYSLEYRPSLLTGDWSAVSGATNVWGLAAGTLSLTDGEDTALRYYRVGVSLP
ncbi:MAG: right-handed parallel beta-helix repeat-containing protein, partial [Kiritimatiellae bacterium]|nr:right-handed parallel beta-helix repeat-containing protein [Kiritimatiellia bacterium]